MVNTMLIEQEELQQNRLEELGLIGGVRAFVDPSVRENGKNAESERVLAIIDRAVRGDSQEAHSIFHDNPILFDFSSKGGTFAALEYIYTQMAPEHPAASEEEEREAFNWFTYPLNSRAVRERKRQAAKLITESIVRHSLWEERTDPFRILSLGSGSARADIEAMSQVPEGINVHGTFLDSDPEALGYSEELARQLGVPAASVTTICGNVFYMGKHLNGSEPFDLIEIVGLFDYLDERAIGFILKHAVSRLKPGGRVLFANIVPNDEAPFVHEVVKWPRMYYRTPEEMAALLGRNGFSLERSKLYIAPSGVYAMAEGVI